MKKLLLLTSFTLLLWTLFSCNNEDLNQKDPDSQLNIDKSELSELGVVTTCTVENDETEAQVGFLESARPFYLNANTKRKKEYLELLKAAATDHSPLKVYLISETNSIAHIEKVSEAELEYYEASKIAPLETKSTLKSVIPSVTIFRQILKEIQNSEINFNFAVDGCYARAHAMRRIIQNNGYDCQKHFVYGNLHAETLSGCCASWRYHVAPLVKLQINANTVKEFIIDPGLFKIGAGTPQAWRNKCTNTNCNITASKNDSITTNGSVLYSTSDRSVQLYDPEYNKTSCVWQAYYGLSGCTGSTPSTAHCGI